MDGAKMHYLSTANIYLEPPYMIEFRRRMKELQMQLESEMKLTEELDKKGLLKFRIEQRFKK